MRKKVAIIAALEREISPLVKDWSRSTHDEGRHSTFFESEYAVVVCGGIGAEAARRAAEVAIVNYRPELLISAGLAGALVSELHVGDTVFPALIIDTQDGSRHETAISESALGKAPLARTVLASFPEIASVVQKQHIAKSYGAHAVDMEAAAVARAAQAHNLPFIAVKAISDDVNLEIAEMNRFVRQGQFETQRFILYVAVRPWLWLRVIRLARNSRFASENLCAWLRQSALIHTIVPGGDVRTDERPVPPQT